MEWSTFCLCFSSLSGKIDKKNPLRIKKKRNNWENELNAVGSQWIGLLKVIQWCICCKFDLIVWCDWNDWWHVYYQVVIVFYAHSHRTRMKLCLEFTGLYGLLVCACVAVAFRFLLPFFAYMKCKIRRKPIAINSLISNTHLRMPFIHSFVHSFTPSIAHWLTYSFQFY